ncbi:MAG: hypothetical protein [Olavius algarvensis Gamma 3 endosymbiont]|nr:MAG: hypothetical protein [Olavius algarvensis Gamma 3 endosymbiont]
MAPLMPESMAAITCSMLPGILISFDRLEPVLSWFPGYNRAESH